MLNFFNTLPFRRKLIVVNILILLPVIVIGTIISINVVKGNSNRAVKNEVTTFGELTASFIVADMLFDDKTAVQESLENFKNLPNVTYATVLNKNYEKIVSYGDINNDILNNYLDKKTSRFEKNDYLYFKPISYKNETLGTLFIVNNNNSLQEVINKIYLGIIGVSIFVFFALIFASTSIQRLIIQPIINLVDIIGDVVETQNYSNRIIQNDYQDEIGLLYNDFNKMLETIDKTTVSQNYLDNVMSSLAELVIVLDEKGRIKTINKAVTKLTGFEIADLENKYPTILIKDFETTNENKLFESSLLTKDNEQYIVSVSVTTFINQIEENQLILSIRDITKQKTAELELKENYAKLERTNKELQELSYILSHDLKAPVRAVGSLITMMKDDFEQDDLSPDMMKDYFGLIQKRIKRMDSLINGILEFSKVGRQDLLIDKINLDVIVQEVIETIVPKNFEINYPTSLPSIHFNQIFAYQIFQNLIGNAVKYNDKQIGKIDILYKDLEDRYQFYIKDNGIGIAPKYHNKVFKVFQMLDARDKTEGTGIGLSIVKKIIERAEGTIRIDSNHEEGVAFIFELPKNVI